MNPASPPLLIPITFSDGPPQSSDSLERNFVSSKPSCIASWNLLTQDLSSNASSGVAVGLTDGSIFVFTAIESERSKTPPTLTLDSSPPSPNRLSISSRHTSRSTSPSSLLFNQPLFNISSRSRIVSGLNMEQVEAPKNYVDYEDEPGRLKDMLKGRSITKHTSDTSSSSTSRHTSPSRETGRGKRKDEPRSLLSATASPLTAPKTMTPTMPATSPRAPHAPNTATQMPAEELQMRFQAIPLSTDAPAEVVGLQVINNTVAILHTSGILSVLELQDGHCHIARSVEEINIQPPLGVVSHHQLDKDIWAWRRLERLDIGEATLLIALAFQVSTSSAPMADPQPSGTIDAACSRLCVFEYLASRSNDMLEASLNKVGDWAVNGLVQNLWVGNPSDASTFSLYLLSAEGHLIHQHLLFSPQPIVFPSQPPQQSSSLPNPFKAILQRASEESLRVEIDHRPLGRIVLVEEIDGGVVEDEEFPQGLSIINNQNGTVMGTIWSSSRITVFEYSPSENLAKILVSFSSKKAKHIHWMTTHTIAISYRDRVEIYELQKVDANNDEITQNNDRGVWHCSLSLTFPVERTSFYFPYSSGMISIQMEGSAKTLTHYALDSTMRRTLWRSRSQSYPVCTVVLPLDLEHIVFGYSDGRIGCSTLQDLIDGTKRTNPPDNLSDISLGGSVVKIHQVPNPRTKELFLIGGADDGSIAFWSLKSLQLLARWIVFTTPLCNVIYCPSATEFGPLRGCALCICADGAIAVVAVDGFQFLYLIPGAVVPLRRIDIGEDNLLLTYKNHRARLWDVRTKEFWRSMAADKADEMVAAGGWTTLTLNLDEQDILLKPLAHYHVLPSNSSTILFNLEKFISDTVKTMKIISKSKDQTKSILLSLEHLKQVLSILITSTTSTSVDRVCREEMNLITSLSTEVGYSDAHYAILYHPKSSNNIWCISPIVSAARLLSICASLKALGLFEELSDACELVISFHSSASSISGDDNFRSPSIIFLARRWFDSSNEIRSSAKMLFDAAILKLSDQEITTHVEKWQRYLPCSQPLEEQQSSTSALALFVCGYIATARYALLTPITLTDISKSIDLYLHDERSPRRVLAIDLCSRGFDIWQHYIDAMGVLRALFTLGTSVRKDAISIQNATPQARLAILQIASSNTPLFITTLGLDILNPSSMEYRKSVLQIIAFLIRKRPLVLYSNLPRLLEAIVKSLDPNSTADRDAVLDTATEILGQVIKTFPTADFHTNTQRLAVGTSEGVVIMYDLKTATRLYVLEGHKERITACSFSPDGRRLVTVSLEEGVTLVWKVGSSFASFFHPGAPPRQGHGGSEPYKTLPFNVGEDANISIAATLESVRVEWPSERSVRLRIRESVLTFST